jgi:hypothetical protein
VRREISSTLMLALALSLAAVPLAAQTKKDKVSGLHRIEGTIESLDDEKRSMRVRQRNRAGMMRRTT